MPVSYARRKFVNVFPDELLSVEELVVLPLELLLLPPQPAATSASPIAAKAAVVTSHLLLRIKWVPPRSCRIIARRRLFQTPVERRQSNALLLHVCHKRNVLRRRARNSSGSTSSTTPSTPARRVEWRMRPSPSQKATWSAGFPGSP